MKKKEIIETIILSNGTTQEHSLFFDTCENEDFQHVFENLPLSTFIVVINLFFLLKQQCF